MVGCLADEMVRFSTKLQQYQSISASNVCCSRFIKHKNPKAIVFISIIPILLSILAIVLNDELDTCSYNDILTSCNCVCWLCCLVISKHPNSAINVHQLQLLVYWSFCFSIICKCNLYYGSEYVIAFSGKLNSSSISSPWWST